MTIAENSEESTIDVTPDASALGVPGGQFAPGSPLRRSFWLVISGLYVWFVIINHDSFQLPILRIQDAMGMWTWQLTVVASLVALSVAGLILVRRIQPLFEGLKIQRVHLAVLIPISVLCAWFLMLTAIEVAHYVQYGILVLLLRPVFKAILPAVFLSILAGTGDEWYQYWMLHPWQGQLDFNDLVLNVVGAVSGAILARCYFRENESPRWWWMWLGILALFSIVMLLPSVDLYADTAQWTLHRFAEPDPGVIASRWVDLGWRSHWFILKWKEAVILCAVIPLILLIPLRKDRQPTVQK